MSPRPFMVMLSDESGPLDSFWHGPVAAERPAAGIERARGWLQTPEQLLDVARTVWPKRLDAVLSMEWAKSPRAFTSEGPVFVITIPGTHPVRRGPYGTTYAPPVQDEIDYAEGEPDSREARTPAELEAEARDRALNRFRRG